jgi:hypothetical protein
MQVIRMIVHLVRAVDILPKTIMLMPFGFAALTKSAALKKPT